MYLPLIHFCAIAPSDEVVVFLPPLLKMFLWYGVGLVFYFSMLPESIRPGAFDYRGGSHLLWHLAVLAAVWCFDDGVQKMLLHRDEVACQGWF